MPTFKRFEEMHAWRSAREPVKCIYEITRERDFYRDFGLRDQIRRAAVSVMSNIAEGFGRSTDKDKCKFFNYAKGSYAEFRAQAYIGIKARYIPEDAGNFWIAESNKISAMLTGLMKYLE